MEFAASVARSAEREPRAVGGALITVAAATAAAAITASGTAPDPAAVAVARAAIVGVPMAAGLFVLMRLRDARFGVLLVAAGAGLLLTTLAESGDEALYTAGRAAGWLVEGFLVYLVLSSPHGRLPGRVDRLLVTATAGTVLVLFVPRLFLAETFIEPSPFTSCGDGCPDNALFAVASEPGLVESFLRPAGALAFVACMVAAVWRLRSRMRASTPAARRMYAPVLAVGTATAMLLAFGFVLRDVGEAGRPAEVVSWALAFAAPALALAYLFGNLRWRVFTGRALRRLAGGADDIADAAALERALEDAFEDASLELAFPAPGEAGGWVDVAGRPVALPARGSGRSATELRQHGAVVAVVAHDEAYDPTVGFLGPGLALTRVMLETQRLSGAAELARRELLRSRARLATAAERERRRIERDLHDGAQQRLVALRIELGLAEDLVRRDPARCLERLREAEAEVDEALEELRALAHGVYPSLLAVRGLAEAVRAAAAQSPLEATVEAHGVGRYPSEIEGAVYFCITEALQNALKHAAGAHRVEIRLDGGARGELRFLVRDDGAGAPGGRLRPGAGLTNMHDRLAAVGGSVEVSSAPGVGTTVRGRVPAPSA